MLTTCSLPYEATMELLGSVTIVRLLLLLFLLLTACSVRNRVDSPVAWNYEEGAIRLDLACDPKLNLFQRQAHALTVCLYQLKDPSAFNQLAGEKDGLPRLLECGRFDPSVTFSRRLVLQPDQGLHESLARTEGARFVGLVAGYYSLQRDSAARLFAIPTRTGDLASAPAQQPAHLDISLYFGPQQILAARPELTAGPH
jgi:type VI secretion system VasD/TssJ family lipoprotein